MASTAAVRYFNPTTGLHHITTTTPEQEALERAGQFKKEGTAFNLLDDSPQNSGAAKVYRLFNSQTGGHLLTTSDEERDKATAEHGYTLEENTGRAFTQAANDRNAVERFRNTKGDYVFTSDADEIARLKGKPGQDFGYSYEGTAFYTPKDATSSSSSAASSSTASAPLPVNSRYADAVNRAQTFRDTSPASKAKIWSDALSKPPSRPGTSDQATMATLADADDDKENSRKGINYLHDMAYLSAEETGDAMSSAISNLKGIKVPSVKDPMAYYQTLLADIKNA